MRHSLARLIGHQARNLRAAEKHYSAQGTTLPPSPKVHPMSFEHVRGASVPDRAGGLRPEPRAASQPVGAHPSRNYNPPSEIEKLLDCLDFNGVHCADVIAAAYYRWSAQVIRQLQRESAHHRRQFVAEQGRRVEAEMDADVIASVMRRLVAQGMEAAPAGETGTGSTEGDSPVAKGDAPQPIPPHAKDAADV